MELFIDILLLLLASAATLVALCGDTLEKGNEPLLKRVTKLGWVSVGLLACALLIGVIDQVQSASASSRSDTLLENATTDLQDANSKLVSSEAKIGKLSEDLQAARDERKKATTERDHMTELLTSARGRVTDLQAQVGTLQTQLQRVRKEMDHSVATLGSNDDSPPAVAVRRKNEPFKYETQLVSGVTGKKLLVSGGDVLDYDLIFNPHGAVGASGNAQGEVLSLDEALRKEIAVKVRIGDTVRRLSDGSDEIHVLGEIKAKMEVTVEVESENEVRPGMLTLKLSVMRSMASEKPIAKRKK